MKKQTKRERQLVNRAVGRTGSIMPVERAQSIARKLHKDPNDERVVNQIRKINQETKPKISPVS